MPGPVTLIRPSATFSRGEKVGVRSCSFSPGRRCPEGADEGLGFAIDLATEDRANALAGTPHPAVPAGFSRGEKGGVRRPPLSQWR
jgi:hypothetical protein